MRLGLAFDFRQITKPVQRCLQNQLPINRIRSSTHALSFPQCSDQLPQAAEQKQSQDWMRCIQISAFSFARGRRGSAAKNRLTSLHRKPLQGECNGRDQLFLLHSSQTEEIMHFKMNASLQSNKNHHQKFEKKARRCAVLHHIHIFFLPIILHF